MTRPPLSSLVRWLRSWSSGLVGPPVPRVRRIRAGRLRRLFFRLPGIHPNAPKRNAIVLFLYAYLLVFVFFL